MADLPLEGAATGQAQAVAGLIKIDPATVVLFTAQPVRASNLTNAVPVHALGTAAGAICGPW